MEVMSKREHKLLLLDFERMDNATALRVHALIGDHLLRTCPNPGATILCLETVSRRDPLLRRIRAWIDGDEYKDEDECEDVVRFLARVCRVCESKDGLRACARCKKVYYCSKDCQVSDWKRHKQTCKLAKDVGSLTMPLPLPTAPRQYISNTRLVDPFVGGGGGRAQAASTTSV